MRFGTGIFLVVVGAILAFAVQDAVDFVNLVTIGYIMMGAGVLTLLISLLLATKKTKATTTQSTIADPTTGESVTRSEREVR
jgi:hypothetical protein